MPTGLRPQTGAGSTRRGCIRRGDGDGRRCQVRGGFVPSGAVQVGGGASGGGTQGGLRGWPSWCWCGDRGTLAQRSQAGYGCRTTRAHGQGSTTRALAAQGRRAPTPAPVRDLRVRERRGSVVGPRRGGPRGCCRSPSPSRRDRLPSSGTGGRGRAGRGGTLAQDIVVLRPVVDAGDHLLQREEGVVDGAGRAACLSSCHGDMAEAGGRDGAPNKVSRRGGDWRWGREVARRARWASGRSWHRGRRWPRPRH